VTPCLPSKSLWYVACFVKTSWGWREGELHGDNAELGGSLATCRSKRRGPEPAPSPLQASLCYSCSFAHFWFLYAQLKISPGGLSENTKHPQLHHSFTGASGTLPLPQPAPESSAGCQRQTAPVRVLTSISVLCIARKTYTAVITIPKSPCWELNYFRSLWL